MKDNRWNRIVWGGVKILVAWVVLFGMVLLGLYLGLGEKQEQTRPPFESFLPFESLLGAMAIVESRCNSNAIGDGGNAAGVFQIWKIYVDDVNRILKREEYEYKDRFNTVKSWEMVRIYLRHYATEKRLGHPPTLEDMARIHNGGPNGYKKKSTVKYWEKVRKVLYYGQGKY